jgi:hypothetical protein
MPPFSATTPADSGRPTLGQWTALFPFFALGLSAALLGAELGANLLVTRIRTTAWVALALSAVALTLYLWPGETRRRRNLWLLAWSLAATAYLVHFGYSFLGLYHGSLRELYAGQRALIATSNLLVTLWWTWDVIHAWHHPAGRWRTWHRTGIHLLVLITFIASALFLFSGPVRFLGYGLVAAVVVALAARGVRKVEARRG